MQKRHRALRVVAADSGVMPEAVRVIPTATPSDLIERASLVQAWTPFESACYLSDVVPIEVVDGVGYAKLHTDDPDYGALIDLERDIQELNRPGF